MGAVDLRRKSVLIVECDTIKLAHQSLSIGSKIFKILKSLFNSNPIELIEITTEVELLKKFSELAYIKRKFRNIIIIGHSNQKGLRISSDRFVKWSGVASWFATFEPQRILLIACNAGRWLPCAFLFNGIQSLKEIYGSPIPTSNNQAYFVILATLYILDAKKTDPLLFQISQLGNFILTKDVIFKQTRYEFQKGGRTEGVLWTVAEPFIEKIINAIRS